MAVNIQNFVPPDRYEEVYAVIRLVPQGNVATYGQIADAVTGVSVTARQVGAALRFAPDDVPWQRILGAGGRLPIAKRSPELRLLQLRLLRNEGTPFLDDNPDQIDMTHAQWSFGVVRDDYPRSGR